MKGANLSKQYTGRFSYRSLIAGQDEFIGDLFLFATDMQYQPFIYLLAMAKVDITSKRNGIWVVKPQLLESLDAPWRDILSKTRHGFIRVE